MACFSLVPLNAQLVSLGAKAGVAMTDPNGASDESRRYIVGPSVQFRLPAGFSVDFSALYRRVGYRYAFFGPYAVTSRQRGNMWDFPLVGKYHFRSERAAWRPFIGTGYSFRTAWLQSEGSTTTPDASGNPGAPTSFKYSSRSNVEIGATFAAGVRLNRGRFALVPELRYTRWGTTGGTMTRKNEGTFLLGFQF